MNWIFNNICKKLIRLVYLIQIVWNCIARVMGRERNDWNRTKWIITIIMIIICCCFCFGQREVEEERKHIMFVTQLYIRRRLCLIICCWPMLETIKQSNFFSCLNLSLDYKTQWRNELFTFVNLLSHVIEVGVLNIQHQTVRWQEHLVLWAGNLF